MKLLVQREPLQPSHDCTLGLMFLAGTDLSLTTIERPWVPASDAHVGGASGISCVPPGKYHLEPHTSDAHPKTWALVNPELDVVHWEDKKRPWLRALVLIHIANWPRELRGCIAVGTRTGIGLNGYQVFDSVKAMRLLQAALPWTDEHTIEITGGV